jgi:hypothetical protein
MGLKSNELAVVRAEHMPSGDGCQTLFAQGVVHARLDFSLYIEYDFFGIKQRQNSTERLKKWPRSQAIQ